MPNDWAPAPGGRSSAGPPMRPALRRRLLLAVMLGVVGLTALAVLSGNVARDLRLLNSANSDNVQWALSQTEVEFLDFETVLASAIGDPAADLKTLRREFDVFYSRITTLRQAAIYAELRKLPEFARNLRIAQQFLDRAVTVIDADDDTLMAGLPTLQRRADEVRVYIRRMSNSALDHFARESDRRRAAVPGGGGTILKPPDV